MRDRLPRMEREGWPPRWWEVEDPLIPCIVTISVINVIVLGLVCMQGRVVHQEF